NWTQLQPGSPIRTPSNQRLFADSPRLIAGYHVLHRLLMPRHPPTALTNLPNTNNQTQKHKNKPKMLASTIQFSNNNQPQPRQQPNSRHPDRPGPEETPHRCFLRTPTACPTTTPTNTQRIRKPSDR